MGPRLPPLFALLCCALTAVTAQERAVPLSPLTPIWSSALPFGESVRLIVGETRLIVAAESRLDALAWASGAPQWSAAMAGTATPLVADGRVFAAADGHIAALSEVTGHVEWRWPAAGVTAPLAYRAGWLFVITADGNVTGLRAADGAPQWTAPHPPARLAAPLTVDGDGLFGVFDDGSLVAWQVSTGQVRWTTQVAPRPGQILAAHGRLYVSAGGRLTAFRQRDGRPEWSFAVNLPAVSRLAADATHIYFGALDNSVRAHRERDGTLAWNAKLSERIVEGLSADAGMVLVPHSNGAVQLLLATSGRRAGTLASPLPDARGATLLATAGEGADLRLARLTAADQSRTIEAFARRTLAVTPASTLTGTPLPWPPAAPPRR